MVAGQQKGLQALVEFLRCLLVEASDGGLLNGVLHALDGAVGPGMRRLGHAVRHAVFAANAVKAVPTQPKRVRLRGELPAVIGQHGVPSAEQLVEAAAQKRLGHQLLGLWVQFGEGPLAGVLEGPE